MAFKDSLKKLRIRNNCSDEQKRDFNYLKISL